MIELIALVGYAAFVIGAIAWWCWWASAPRMLQREYKRYARGKEKQLAREYAPITPHARTWGLFAIIR